MLYDVRTYAAASHAVRTFEVHLHLLCPRRPRQHHPSDGAGVAREIGGAVNFVRRFQLHKQLDLRQLVWEDHRQAGGRGRNADPRQSRASTWLRRLRACSLRCVRLLGRGALPRFVNCSTSTSFFGGAWLFLRPRGWFWCRNFSRWRLTLLLLFRLLLRRGQQLDWGYYFSDTAITVSIQGASWLHRRFVILQPAGQRAVVIAAVQHNRSGFAEQERLIALPQRYIIVTTAHCWVGSSSKGPPGRSCNLPLRS